MNIKKLGMLILSTGLIPAFASAQSQMFTQNVTFSLTKTYSLPTLIETDAYGVPVLNNGNPIMTRWNSYQVTTNSNNVSKTTFTEERGIKTVTQKISNKEILDYLVSMGAINTIVGYSIVYISRNTETSAGGDQVPSFLDSSFGKFYLKNGSVYLDVSAYMDLRELDSGGTFPRVENAKQVGVTINDGSDNFNVTSASAKVTGKSAVSFALNLQGHGWDFYAQPEGQTFRTHAIAAWSSKFQKLGPSLHNGYTIPGATNITGNVGFFLEAPANQNREIVNLIEGTIKLSAGVPVTLP